MTSLKALKSIHLVFSLQSRCAGLALTQQLTASKLKATNPDCKVTYDVRPFRKAQPVRRIRRGLSALHLLHSCAPRRLL